MDLNIKGFVFTICEMSDSTLISKKWIVINVKPSYVGDNDTHFMEEYVKRYRKYRVTGDNRQPTRLLDMIRTNMEEFNETNLKPNLKREDYSLLVRNTDFMLKNLSLYWEAWTFL